MTDTQHPHEFSPKLNILKVPADPDQPMEFTAIDDNLEAIQQAIGGGYIEIVRNPDFKLGCGCKLVMVVDEEGMLKQLPANPRVADFYPLRPIAGDVFFIGEGFIKNIDGEEDMDFVTLPESWTTWGGPGHWPLPE